MRVTTPSHGGLKLNRERWDELPAAVRDAMLTPMSQTICISCSGTTRAKCTNGNRQDSVLQTSKRQRPFFPSDLFQHRGVMYNVLG